MGCRDSDVIEMSTKPRRHVVGILIANGEWQLREKTCSER